MPGDSTTSNRPAARSLVGTVLLNAPVSSGLLRIDLKVAGGDIGEGEFQPGQFSMINLQGRDAFVFSRPFSILDWEGDRISFLYRVVGKGTAAMAELKAGDSMTILGPLGRGFPLPEQDVPVVVVAGGVGLPPVWSWWKRHARPTDRAFFGGRDTGDIPWGLVDDTWRVSVDRLEGTPPSGREATEGLVTELVDQDQDLLVLSGPRLMLACGPHPLLKAADALARRRGWKTLLSLEEQMGCGYGVCKGCVVQIVDRRADVPPDTIRNATCCDEGPVFRGEDLVW